MNDIKTRAQRFIMTSKDRKASDIIRALLNELEQSYTFDDFLAAAKKDNDKNLGKSRKMSDWMAAIEQELKGE